MPNAIVGVAPCTPKLPCVSSRRVSFLPITLVNTISSNDNQECSHIRILSLLHAMSLGMFLPRGSVHTSLKGFENWLVPHSLFPVAVRFTIAFIHDSVSSSPKPSSTIFVR